ncbi:MAG: hypothetical protein ACLVJH_02000 [Faecalibacterium prausnitzii]
MYDELAADPEEHQERNTARTRPLRMVQWSSNLMKELEDAQKLEGSADEKKIRTVIDRTDRHQLR